MEIWQAYSVEQTVCFESQTDRVLIYVEYIVYIIKNNLRVLITQLQAKLMNSDLSSSKALVPRVFRS